MVDQVVDGHADDADQPGHNPGPKQKATYWPAVYSVNLPTRDGQAIPIGAVYKGVVGGANVYALMTETTPSAPPVPITLDGQDCDGATVPATGMPGQLVQVVQPPGQVLKVQLCDAPKDIEKVVLCDKNTGHKVAVISDLTDPLAPVVTTWDLNAAAPWVGSMANLEACPGVEMESDQVEMCDNGVTFLRWVVKSNGEPTGDKFDTDMALQPYTVANESAVKVGKCEASCAKSPLGVLTSWAI